MATDLGVLRRVTRAQSGVVRAARCRRGLRPRTSAFVHGLLARGAIGSAIVRPVETTLRAIGRAPMTQVTYLDARLDVRLAFTTRLAPAIRSRARVEPMLPWTPAPVPIAGDDAPAPIAPPGIIEQIFTRERRIEVTPAHPITVVRPDGAASGRAPGVTPATPSLRPRQDLTVRRSVVVMPAPPAAQPATPLSSPLRPDRIAVGHAPQVTAAARGTIPLSPSELGRLTNDVVRVLNSRVVAHRERQGAI